MAFRSPTINVMVRAAERAGRTLVRDFGEVEQLQVSKKGPADFVSTADFKAEKTIRAELAKARPGFGFLMEESAEVKGADGNGRWIVDPLDGTTNFLHGIPHFAISIAAEVNGEVTAGVIMNPVTNELFYAEKGKGAFVQINGGIDRRLRVSGRRLLEESLIGTGAPFKGHGDIPKFLGELDEILPKVAGIRRMGAAALDLAYVAAGRLDAFWETGLNAWDVAAGIILVSEAGGYVTEINGKRDPLNGSSILAANTHLHLPVAKMLKSAAKARPVPEAQPAD